jgi:WD40 repeat protein
MEDIDSQFELELSDTLTSINLSKDGRYLLANVSLKSPKLELYDLNRREVIHRYRGHKQEMYIIRCAFGGVNESFVLCGSEDASIYIWNKEKGDLIARLDGHTQVINAVHWNPQDPFIFASASDD